MTSNKYFTTITMIKKSNLLKILNNQNNTKTFLVLKNKENSQNNPLLRGVDFFVNKIPIFITYHSHLFIITIE